MFANSKVLSYILGVIMSIRLFFYLCKFVNLELKLSACRAFFKLPASHLLPAA